MKKTFSAILALALCSLPLFAQDNTVQSAQVYKFAGAPSSGTSQIDTLTIGGTPTGGTFIITATIPGVSGTTTTLRSTAPISWSATNATLFANINAALAAVNWSGTSGITATANSITAGIGTITLTYGGILGKRATVPILATTAASLTGTSPTAAITIATPGVDATFRNAEPGTLLIDNVTPGLYQNTSATKFNPTWTGVTVP